MLQSLLVVLPLAGLLLLPLAFAGLWRRSRRLAAVGSLLAVAVFAALAVWPGWCRATSRGGDVESGDSFVVFSFGLGPKVNGKDTAGASNRALAEWLVANNPRKKPTVVQRGVSLALEELAEKQPGLLNGWNVISLPERNGFYIDTNGAAFQTDSILAKLGLKKPVLVAHDLQLWRMVRAFEGMGITDVVVPDMPPTPFDPGSVQHPGTRYRWCWLPREVFAARPLTLAPQTTVVVVGLVALLYGLAVRRRTGFRPVHQR